MVALYCTIRCILYPGTKICIASGTRGQANEVIGKIIDDFMKEHTWGSANLRREITYANIGSNKAEVHFRNHSWIKVVTASDNARGARANIIVLDEYRMIEKSVIDKVLKKFLTSPRHPLYLDKPEYAHLKERNKEMYMSSAWYQDSWAYEKVKDYFAAMMDDTRKFFVCGIPYQMAIKEDLLMREQVEDEMAESTFDEISFMMEMGALFYGDADGAFFSFSDISARRTLKLPMYPPDIIDKNTYDVPALKENERRILSVDVALMASTKKRSNDASAIMINSAIPKGSSYVANIVYTKNLEGLTTDDLALEVRRLYDEFKCTDLVLDTNGVGISVFDKLIQDMVDPQSGKLYHALTCRNDKDMAARCKADNAPAEIWSIKATASFNNEICILLRSGFKNGKINLLVPEQESKEHLAKKYRSYSKMTPNEKVKYDMPYINTTLLVNELVKLEYETNGTNIKVRERSGMRKDRYSSLAYNFWVMTQLEFEVLRKPKKTYDPAEYVKKLQKLNSAPVRY